MFSLERSFSIRISASETRIRRNDIETYTEPIVCKSPNEMAEYRKFVFEFYRAVYQRHGEFENLLEEHPDTLGKYYRNLVLNRHTVSYEDFWQRYLYKCEILPKLYDNGDFEEEDSETGERSMGINDYATRRNTNNDDEDREASLNDIDNEDAASILQALVDRGVSAAVIQSLLNGFDINKSVSRIQALVRGYRTRKYDMSHILYQYVLQQEQQQQEQHEREAAIVIQSFVRGYITRRYHILDVLYQYLVHQDQDEQT